MESLKLRDALKVPHLHGEVDLAAAVASAIFDEIRSISESDAGTVDTTHRREYSALKAAERLMEASGPLEYCAQSMGGVPWPFPSLVQGYHQSLDWLLLEANNQPRTLGFEVIGNVDMKTVDITGVTELKVTFSDNAQRCGSVAPSQAIFGACANLVARAVCEYQVEFAKELCRIFPGAVEVHLNLGEPCAKELCEAAVNYGFITLSSYALNRGIANFAKDGFEDSLTPANFAEIKEPELLRLLVHYNEVIATFYH